MKEGMNAGKSIIYVVYALLLGGFTGGFIWLFLRIVSLGIGFVWNYVPSVVDIPCYTIIMCLAGGVIAGILRIMFGSYPESMETVIAKVKRDGKYPYDKTFIIVLCAFVPLIFGASVGPEAGLTGVVVGLCYWVGDKLRFAGSQLGSFTSLGISAVLGVLFGSPLFGITADIEPKTDDKAETAVLPKPFEIFGKITAVSGGLLVYFLLGQIFGSGMSFTQLAVGEITNFDRLLGIPFILLGVILGMLYAGFKKLSYLLFEKLSKTKLLTFLSTVLGGLMLGIIGTILPMTMFSGEEEISEIAETYMQYAPAMLIITGVAKLFLTSFCIESGLKGGNLFPMIFSGVAIGYGISMLVGSSPTMTIATITAALLAVNMRKPLAVSLLLLLCFPVRVIPWMIIASFISANIPLPKFLKVKE